jgi:hypothetical protein
MPYPLTPVRASPTIASSSSSCGASWAATLKRSGLSRPNVSSCFIVITLHGRVVGMEERRTLEERVCRVPGVRDVVNKTEIAQTL